MSAPSFQMSSDARLIYQRLRKAEVGETVKHDDLSAEVSRPLESIRGAINTALRRVLRDDGAVFVNVRSVGYRRCDDVGIVDNSVADTTALRRSARRGAERLTKVADFAALPPGKQVEHTARLSIMSAVGSMTRETAVEKVRKAAQGRSAELPLAETVRAFLK
jgi:hypothetical protein